MIYASGMTEKGCPYIVMQFLGKNLTVLRKEREEAKFTPSTSFRVAAQVYFNFQVLPYLIQYSLHFDQTVMLFSTTL